VANTYIMNNKLHFKLNKEIIKSVCILSFIYFLGISAILRANFNYIDDMGRVFGGYREWGAFSRYLSDFLSVFIHADSYLTDISPLPQLIAVVILAISSVIVLYVITEKTKFTFWEFSAVIPLGLSPYFLECISYKFDSPYMAISVLASVFPLLFYKRKSIIYMMSSVLGIMLVCTTYQAATGIFPMLVVLVALIMWSKKDSIREILNFILISLAGYIIGLVIFKLFIMQSVETYVSNMICPIDRIVPDTVFHLKKYFWHIKRDFKNEWLILIALICVFFIYNGVKKSKRNKIISFFVVSLSMFTMAVLSFGIYPVLSSPLYEPRAMYGFGAFVAFIAVFVTSSEKIYPAKVISLALSWMFFVFALTYGNALFVQKTYTDFRITETINDLKDLDVFTNDEQKTVQISGTIGLAPAIKNIPQDYLMLRQLIPVTYGNSEWYWARYGFEYYYGLKNMKWNDKIDLTSYDLPILKETIYHTIKGNEDCILIELKE